MNTETTDLPQAELVAGEVHVWSAFLPTTPLDHDHARSILSQAELRRAQRLRFDRDRDLFLLAHTMLRTVLGQYVRTNASELQFRWNDYGKPSLDAGAGSGDLQFNLSHSAEAALLGVTRGARIGVDVERFRVATDIDSLAASILSEPELAEFRRLPAAEREYAFFQLWTKKEALVKAVGKGLSLPPKGFAVGVGAGPSPRVGVNVEDVDGVTHWSLESIHVHPQYAAAVAVSSASYHLRFFQWDPTRHIR